MTQLLIKTIADFSTTLTSKASIGDTTATLTSGIDADGVQLPTGVYGFTIDRNNAQKEHFTATLTVDALTDIKTVTRGTGVGAAGFVRTHRKGAEIVITDHVALKRIMNVLDGTTSFDSATPLGYDGAPTISTGNQFATKTYVDGIAIAGSPDATTTTKGIGRVSVAPVSAATPIFVGDNDTRVAPNNHATSTGSVTSYGLTLSPTPAALVKGQMYSFVASFTTSGASTLAVAPHAAKSIKKLNGTTDLAAGDIVSGMLVTVIYDGTNFQMVNPVATAPTLYSKFGDGSDGDVIISSNTSLTRDMYYNNLTIQNGFVLSPKGFRIFVKNTLTFQGTGVIASNGGNGGVGGAGGLGTGGTAGATGAADYTAGSLPAPVAGQVGGVGGTPTNAGSNGTIGASNAKSIGSLGSAGGAGTTGGQSIAGSGPGAGGTAGGAGAQTGTVFNKLNSIESVYLLLDTQPSIASFTGTAGSGSGSGGGGGKTTNSGDCGGGGGGGGSGASGGFVWIAAYNVATVNGNDYIQVKGGNGGNGGAGGNSTGHDGGGGSGGGGGAGGSGGVAIVIYRTKTGTGTVNLSGGTAGTGGALGTKNALGTDGTAGNPGTAGVSGVSYIFSI